MLRKDEFLKDIQRIGDLKSIKEAEDCYNTVMQAIKEGILKADSVKIPEVCIIKKVEKKGRDVKVPGIEDKVKVPSRLGLSIKEDDIIKFELNK